MINDDNSVSSVNEKEEMKNMQDLDEVVKMFPEEENDEYLRSTGHQPKRNNADAVIDILAI